MKIHTFAFTDISILDINTVPVTPSAFQNKINKYKYFPGYYLAQIGPFLFSFSLESCDILYCHYDGEACLIVIMENKKRRYRGRKKDGIRCIIQPKKKREGRKKETHGAL